MSIRKWDRLRGAAVTACTAAFAMVSVAWAQPVQLFERGTPASAALLDPATGRYAVPAVDWAPYLEWVRGGRAVYGPLSAIIDSGVLSHHPFIAPVLAEAIDLTGEGPEDRVGHGTTVALIYVAGGGNPKLGFPRLLSIKIFGGTEQAGAERMEQAINLAAQRGARIANVSAGVFTDCANRRDPAPLPYIQPCDDQPICRAVRAAAEQGMLVVAAVGNDPAKTGCPACCGDAMAVGAADPDGKPAPYSGKFPDILAPGRVELVPLLQSR